MEEALDLEGDLARWQVLCKAPFPNTRDSRVAERLADGQWGWYYRTALRTVIQAAGRVVRAPDDYGATYLADSSILDLFDRARGDMPDWFADQVDRMEQPDLPAPDADAALAGVDVTVGADESSPSATRGASQRSQASGSSPPEDGQSTTGDRRRPISDVWETD
jgi:hypothetical protein